LVYFHAMRLLSAVLSGAILCLGGQAAAQTEKRPAPDLCAIAPGAPPALPARILDGMGVTNMPVRTKSAEAQAFFNQGMAQVHSFWFMESERSFLQAAALDPDMAMAYWGVAVSAAGDYRPSFQLIRDPNDGGRAPAREAYGSGETTQRTASGAAVNARIRAREAIEKAMGLRDKVSERERLYIEAVAARRDPANKEPDKAYILKLRQLVQKYPDDLEAKSMLGLALLYGYEPVSKDAREGTLEGLRLLEGIVARDDNHFGAHHYLIHGYEGGKTPEKAWRACQRYPELVSNIPHALHMPGHIYAQSDKIDEAIAAFSAAAQNERTWLDADVLYPNGHHGHNVHFLIQALNLDGRYRDSLEQARHLLGYKESPRDRTGDSQRTPYRQGYYALVKTLVRFERWEEILDEATIPAYDKPEQQAWRHWSRGLAFAATGNESNARESLAEMEVALAAIKASRQPLLIAAQELEGTIAARFVDRKKGLALMRKAADREAALIYSEPPSYPRPVVEGLASVALALGEAGVAEQAYRHALEREPGSGRAYFGLAAALTARGRTADAREMLARGLKAWDKADEDLPQLRQARTATASR